MRLKMLFFPFFVVVILILGIGYIKPDFDTVMEKNAEISDKQSKVADMDGIVANIKSLNNVLDTEQKTEQFIYRYLPKTLSQEQVIDAFNFLAPRSGLAISKMEFKPLPVTKDAEAPLIAPAAKSFVAGGRTLADSNVPDAAPPIMVKTFVFKGTVIGSYANIKTFFDQMAQIERFQQVRFFSIENLEKAEAGKVAVTDRLTGTFEAEYGYLPPRPIVSALENPIFSQSKFNFSDINTLLSKITSPMSILEKGETGKPNPFQ